VAASVLETQLSTELDRSLVVHLVQVEEKRATSGQRMFDLLVTDVQKETDPNTSVMLSALSLLLTCACATNLTSRFGAVIAAGLQMPVVPLFALLAVAELARFVAAKSVGVQTRPPLFLPSPQIGALGAFSGVQTPCPSRAAALMVALAAPLAMAVGSLLCLAAAASTPFTSDEWQALHKLQQVHMPVWPLELLGSSFHPLAWAGAHGLVMACLALLPHSPDGQVVWSCLHGRSFAKRLGDITLYAYPVVGVLFMSAENIDLVTLPLTWTFFLINFSPPEKVTPPLEELSEVPLAGRLVGYLALAIAAVGALPVPLSSLV